MKLIYVPRRSHVVAAGLLLVGGVGGAQVAYAATSAGTATCSPNPAITSSGAAQTFTLTCSVPVSVVTTTATTTATVTKTVTATSSSSTTAATPTTTSSTTASPTSTAAPAPPATGCVRPDASNTGPTGTLTNTGMTTISTPGTYENLNFTGGGVTITANGVTLRNFRVNGGVLIQAKSGPTLLDHGDIIDTASSSASNVTYQSMNIHNSADDAIHITSDNGAYISGITIKNSWIHNPVPPAGAHFDGMQVRGASNVRVQCNAFEFGTFQDTFNAAIYFEYANGGYSGVTVADNWLVGSAWSTMWGTANDASTTLTGNHFSGDIHWGTCYAQQSNSRPPVQSGNDLNGKPFTPCA